MAPLLLSWLLIAWIPPPVEQTLAIVTPDWAATSGTATLWQGGERVWGPHRVWVGHAGLGWGIGLHPADRRAGPVKREGDGRAPAGVFRVGPSWSAPWTRFAHCVDDPTSPDYGRIVTRPPAAAARWRSAEDMTMYRLAIEVEHNPAPRKGAGSCIFLHDGTEPTVGCTAMPARHLDALAEHLRPGARLIQLPRREYVGYRKAWSLPAL